MKRPRAKGKCSICGEFTHNRNNRKYHPQAPKADDAAPLEKKANVRPKCELCEGVHQLEGICPILEKIREEDIAQNYVKYVKDPCSICLDDMLKIEVQALVCGCIYHAHCVAEWLERNNTCPICRTRQ